MSTGEDDKRRQAAEWVVRQDIAEGNAFVQERIRAWLSEHPENQRYYDQLKALWSEFGSLADDPDVRALTDEAYLKDPSQPTVSRYNVGEDRHALRGVGRRDAWRRFAPMAAAACAVFFLAAVFFVTGPSLGGFRSFFSFGDNAALLTQSEYEYRTDVGEQRTVSLPDGSTIFMNTDTMLKVEYSKAQRNINLLHGEAQFDVARDSARPFIVAAKGKNVRAIGTQFVVYLVDKTLSVTVLEGTVEVNESRRRGVTESVAELNKGEEIRYADPEARPVLGKAQRLESIGAWRTGHLHFDDDSLEEVVADLNRYASRKVIIDDQSLAGIRLSGVFRIGETRSVLRALEASFSIRAVEKKDAIHLVRKTL